MTPIRRIVLASLPPALWTAVTFGLLAAPTASAAEFAQPAFYVTATFDADDRARLGQLAHDTNLRLELVARTAGDVLRSAAVSVFTARGERVLDAVVGGWLLARLPPGRYRVVVDDGDRRHERFVWLTGNASRTLRFAW
jgi:hypothetical protein